jgi:hypothetical protein
MTLMTPSQLHAGRGVLYETDIGCNRQSIHPRTAVPPGRAGRNTQNSSRMLGAEVLRDHHHDALGDDFLTCDVRDKPFTRC